MKSKERMLLDELFNTCQIIVRYKYDKSEELFFKKRLSKIVEQIECERSGKAKFITKGGV